MNKQIYFEFSHRDIEGVTSDRFAVLYQKDSFSPLRRERGKHTQYMFSSN